MDVSISLPEVVEAAGEDLDVLPVELELWPLGREPLADARPRKVLVHTDPGHEVYSSVQQQQRPHLTDYSRPGLQGNMTFFTLFRLLHMTLVAILCLLHITFVALFYLLHMTCVAL